MFSNPDLRRSSGMRHIDTISQRAGLKKLRMIADFQFGPPGGKAIFPERTRIEYSAKTGRIRRATYRGRVIATLIPSTGLLALTLLGAQRFAKVFPPPRQRVIVGRDVAEFVAQGKSVFAKHVVNVDPELRPGDEAIVTDVRNRVLAIGKALLSPEEMLSFQIGVAVKVRAGSKPRPS
jgi:uncharacterized protein with predicted RNA binding PUA domain